MRCAQCQVMMVNVGRMIKPGHPEIWLDGYVCPVRGCHGYGTLGYDGESAQWPGLTLMGNGIHLNIAGAIKFKERS